MSQLLAVRRSNAAPEPPQCVVLILWGLRVWFQSSHVPIKACLSTSKHMALEPDYYSLCWNRCWVRPDSGLTHKLIVGPENPNHCFGLDAYLIHICDGWKLILIVVFYFIWHVLRVSNTRTLILTFYLSYFIIIYIPELFFFNFRRYNGDNPNDRHRSYCWSVVDLTRG